MKTSSSGALAETRALNYLKQQGLRLLCQNFTCKRGEIDLIMNDGNTIVFVEVRYRRDQRFGTAAETVSRSKQAKLIYAAQFYLQKQRQQNKPCRFDVIAMTAEEAEPAIQWIKNAFGA
jgi:putative endonuclease